MEVCFITEEFRVSTLLSIQLQGRLVRGLLVMCHVAWCLVWSV